MEKPHTAFPILQWNYIAQYKNQDSIFHLACQSMVTSSHLRTLVPSTSPSKPVPMSSPTQSIAFFHAQHFNLHQTPLSSCDNVLTGLTVLTAKKHLFLSNPRRKVAKMLQLMI